MKTLLGGLALALMLVGCEPFVDPGCRRNCDGVATVFGRITTTSGLVVPDATVTVKFFGDTARTVWDELICAGEHVANASEDLDAEGDYEITIRASGAAGRRVCVEVTGDPHNKYSDVGLRRINAGWLVLSPSKPGTVAVAMRVDMKYAETP